MDKWNNKRKACPGHGFWIVTNDFFDTEKHPMYCSVCGAQSPEPSGDFCRWCGTHMNQKPLILTSPSTNRRILLNGIPFHVVEKE